MGSGNLIKAIIRLKKSKQGTEKVCVTLHWQLTKCWIVFYKSVSLWQKKTSAVKPKKGSKKKGTSLVTRSEDWAATRIQTAFKAYKVLW